uniref:PBPe domain-containing protein n=2 Tax=Macrostomum lignano TaxID=282301 RepID=A0A1I8IYQ8_9PLAT
EYLWSIIGSFMQQGQDFYPFCMSSRTVLAFWWLFTVIIYASYTGDLTAHLTVTVTDYPIKTLQDLVSQTAIKPYVSVGTNLHTLLAQSNSGIYKQMADMMVEIGPYEECPSFPRKADEGCMNDYSFLLAIAMKNCSEYYVADELFNTATLAFMFPEDAYYADSFNFQLQKLHESGQIQRWFEFYWSSDTVCTVGKSAEADAINLEGVGGCFIIALSLFVAGLLILTIELIWTNLAKKQPLDCLIY